MMLRDWPCPVTFFCFALPAVGKALLLFAVGFALVLLAVGFALLPAVALLFSVVFILAPDLRVLLAVLVLLLLSFDLLTTGSLAVVPSRILTTCSLAVVPSPILSHHWLFGCGSICASSESFCGGLRLRGSFLASSSSTAHRCVLRD